MYLTEINEMVDGFVNDKLIAEQDRENFVKSLRKYWTDKIAITWTADDVADACPGLTEEEAIDVLWKLFHDHDSERGINWDSIRDNAVIHYGKRALEDDDDAEENEE